MNDNNFKISFYIFTSVISVDEEKNLNDNSEIHFSIIPANNFSKEDVIIFMIEIAQQLPVTIICALLKEAFMKILKKKISPKPSKFVAKIKESDKENIYEFVSDFELSEKSIDTLVESIAARIRPENSKDD